MKPRLDHLTLAFLFVAGCGGGEGGVGGPGVMPSDTHLATQVLEVEITQDSETITVDRFDITYDGQRLDEIKGFRNGMAIGTTRFTYGVEGIEAINYVDKEAHTASERWTYAGGQLASVRYEVPGVFTWVNQISYDAQLPTLPNKLSGTTTQAGGLVSTDVLSIDYDDGARTEKTTRTHEDGTDTTEFDYTEGDRIDRTTSFRGGEVVTNQFTYTPDGQLLAITGSGTTSDLEYDGDGRISEIRSVREDGRIITYRYKYGTDLMAGLTFAPSVAFGRYFDLGGVSHSARLPAHEWFESFMPEELEVAGETCTIDPDSGDCRKCLAEACCAEALACGTECSAADEDALNACANENCPVCF